MTTDEMIERLTDHGRVTFALSPTRTRYFATFEWTYDQHESVSRLGDTPNDALFRCYTGVVEQLMAPYEEVSR